MIYIISFHYKKKQRVSKEMHNLIKNINKYIILYKNGQLLEEIKKVSLNPKVSIVIPTLILQKQ